MSFDSIPNEILFKIICDLNPPSCKNFLTAYLPAFDIMDSHRNRNTYAKIASKYMCNCVPKESRKHKIVCDRSSCGYIYCNKCIINGCVQCYKKCPKCVNMIEYNNDNSNVLCLSCLSECIFDGHMKYCYKCKKFLLESKRCCHVGYREYDIYKLYQILMSTSPETKEYLSICKHPTISNLLNIISRLEHITSVLIHSSLADLRMS